MITITTTDINMVYGGGGADVLINQAEELERA